MTTWLSCYTKNLESEQTVEDTPQFNHNLSLTTHLSQHADMTDHHVQLSLSEIKRFLILKIHATALSSTVFSHSHRFGLVNIRKNVLHLSECATQLVLQPPDISRLNSSNFLLAGLLSCSITTLQMIQNMWHVWFLTILNAYVPSHLVLPTQHRTKSKTTRLLRLNKLPLFALQILSSRFLPECTVKPPYPLFQLSETTVDSSPKK